MVTVGPGDDPKKGVDACVWKVASGALHARFVQPGIRTAAFAKDGKCYVITATADKTATKPSQEQWAIRVWEAVSGSPIGTAVIHSGKIAFADVASDGTRLITTRADHTGADHFTSIWDTATGQTVGAPLQHPEPVLHAALDPDNRRLLTVTGGLVTDPERESAAYLWDLAKDTASRERKRPEAAVLLSHRGKVEYACFSRDGRLVVTASADQTARIWEAATGKPITPPLRHFGDPEIVRVRQDQPCGG